MEEDSVQELSLKDFEGIELDPNWFQIDYLAAIAKRALAILDHKEHRKKQKGKQRLSHSDHLVEDYRKKKDKGKRKLSHLDQLDLQPNKKIKEGEEFPEGVISRVKETRQRRLSKGVCIKECSERVIRRSEQCKKSTDSLVSREEILKRERLLKRPMVADETESHHEYQESKKIKKNKKIIKKLEIDHGPNPPPELPIEFMETLQKLARGKAIEELKLVIQKGLFGTDISKGHNRLSLPSRRLLHEFLTNKEFAELQLYNGKNVNKIEADIIEPSLEKGKLSLRRWEMKKESGNSSISYVLTGTWNNIVSRNLLDIGDVLQVWSVRVDGQLWFLLVRVPSGRENVPISTARVLRASDPEYEIGPSASPSDPSEPAPSASSSDRGHD